MQRRVKPSLLAPFYPHLRVVSTFSIENSIPVSPMALLDPAEKATTMLRSVTQ
jgi:hypothetical protein